MKPLTIKRRLRPCIVLCTLFISPILLSACGSGSGPDTAENASSGTGSISFSIAWEGTTRSIVDQAVQPPSGDVCVDYGIEMLSADVEDSTGTAVASASWYCSDHQGTISDVATGSGMRLVLEGTVSENVDWRGQTATFTVSAGKTTNAGTVTMSYVGSDMTPPDVSSTDPSDGDTGVALDVVITAVLSEKIVEASVSTSSFTLETNGTPISGFVSYNSSTKTATFDPDSNLSESTEYTATITTGVQDLASNQITEDYIWNFTTQGDTIAPTVTSTIPADSATGVAVDTNINATFSESMDPSTINDTNFTVGVTGTVTYDTNTKTATFTPDADLNNEITYTATITAGVEDLAGNPLGSDYTWTFTTEPADITTGLWDVSSWDNALWSP